MGILRFYWLRHAPPINPGDICYGQQDIPVDLSDDAAFAAMAARLPRHGTWMTSSSARAIDTARKLASFHDNADSITPRPDAALLEQSFGAWETMTRAAMVKTPEFAAYYKDPASVAMPGGESMNDLAARILPAIDRIVADHPQGGDVVIVAHGGTIRAALHHATGMTMQDTLRLGVLPLSLTTITYDAEKQRSGCNPWAVEGLNIRP